MILRSDAERDFGRLDQRDGGGAGCEAEVGDGFLGVGLGERVASTSALTDTMGPPSVAMSVTVTALRLRMETPLTGPVAREASVDFATPLTASVVIAADVS
ncbi:hypothetical protein [Streptomyces sp. NPDC001930]|uniref:hypothetical protein n=1 Tax=Streptomyces sp. NPDC001930 TaxID=3364625 RepID=UPI00367F6E50